MSIKARDLFLTRRERIRFALKKNPEKPRLVVFRSNQHIYAQLIDNAATVASASTLEKELGLRDASNNIEAAKVIGKVIAERAKKLNISKIVFDRGGYIYHGRVKALADAARDAGLIF